jgi:hypothetical protein
MNSLRNDDIRHGYDMIRTYLYINIHGEQNTEVIGQYTSDQRIVLTKD